jgi:tetratricopeptide (TPR) repeat protein
MRRALLTVSALLLLARNGAAQTVQTWDGTDRVFRSLARTPAIDSAQTALDAQRDNPAAYIELARAQAGARQMREAVATLTAGLERFPSNAQLLRWRGHRYLNLRELDRAALDLERGVSIDPGIYGLWYHLGIVRFLRGEHLDAIAAFERARPLAPDSAEAAGAADWLWSSMRMAGLDDDAAALLRSLPAFRGVNNAYTRRLRLYGRHETPRRMLTAADTVDTQRATLAFGTAVYQHLRTRPSDAPRWLREAVATTGWPAFGFIGAEQMLAHYGETRMRDLLGARAMFLPAVSPPTEREASCYAQIPTTAMRRANLSVRLSHVTLMPHARARQLADAYGARLRTAVEAHRRTLTGRDDSLPDATPRLTWLDVENSEAFILISRDGRTQLEPSDRIVPTDSALTFLAELVEAVRQLPLPPLTWNDNFGSDTLAFVLRLAAPVATAEGLHDITTAYVSIPAATVMVPVRTPWSVSGLAQTIPRTPRRPDGLIETLRFEYIVTEAGKVDSGSVRAVNLPFTRSREEYAEFMDYEARSAGAMRSFQYLVGTFGGCAARVHHYLHQGVSGQ